MTTHYDLYIPPCFLTEQAAAEAAKKWAGSKQGRTFIDHHCEPGAVLYTFRTGEGWDWAVKNGEYDLTSEHLTDGYTVDIFTGAGALAKWLGINRVKGDVTDLIKRAVLGTLPLVTDEAEEQSLLFRLLLTLAPDTPEEVINLLIDDPSQVVAHHAINRALKTCDDQLVVRKALNRQQELDDELIDLLNEQF